MEEFRSLATKFRDVIQLVLLGAAQTDEQAGEAEIITREVLGEGMKILRLPSSLLTKEGKESGMLNWFLEQVEGQ